MSQKIYSLAGALEEISLLEASGRIAEAQSAYEQLLNQDPKCASAWHGLGLLLLNVGNLRQATELVGKAVALEPREALFQRNFCELCRRLGLLDQAIHSGLAAVKLAPKDLDAHFNLGLAYTDSGDFLKAIQSYRKCLKLNPKHAQSWNNLGSALESKGDETAALKAYKQATLLDPNNAEAQNNQGVLYVDLGDLENATTSFNLAIATKPSFIECHYNLSSLKTYTPSDPHLRMLEEASAYRAQFNDQTRIRYHFALGKALEDVGQYDRAFAAYDEANHIQHALLPVDEVNAEKLATEIKKIFTKKFFKERQDWVGSEKSPIFIVGMPRSGTTLLEQILSSHKSVYGAGELTDLSQTVHSVSKLKPGELFTEKVIHLSAAQLKKIGDQYSKKVWQLSPDSHFISDKMPANYMYLGLIHLAFPNAKIIHAMRDPMDSCFSCYARLFNDTMDMTYDLETIGRYYVRYIKLMEHWHKVLPAGRLLDLHYEELVTDPPAQTRRILDFVGLPWDDQCLEFYKNKRLVKTASLAQVNKPIYKTSIARWRHFAKHLKPLIDLVKDYRPKDEYPADDAYIKPAISAPVTVNLATQLIQRCLELQSKNLDLEVLQFLGEYLNPQLPFPEVWHLAGISLYRLGRFDEAKNSYENALRLKPDFTMALNSYGFLLQDMGYLEQARDAYSRALELAPEFSMARFNLSTAQLKLGDYAAGWENYESRWFGSAEASANNLQMPECPLPKWAGQSDTENQSLLVITEQGFGDTFQFARYLSLAAQRFRKVGFVCSIPTLRLMEWAVGNEIALFNRMPTDYATWDWQSPLLSLPKAFQTRLDTIPSTLPYLTVPPTVKQHWGERVNNNGPARLRVGIAWAGRNTHIADSRRSLAFAQVLPLLQQSNIHWYSLQKWMPGDVRPAIPQGVAWFDWADEFIDFADTAGLISNLDLIISIDSAPVHLAGALNIPVWMLNRFDGEWRWLNKREDSPWYPSLRIFNQTEFGNWSGVIEEINGALSSLSSVRSLTIDPQSKGHTQPGILPILSNQNSPIQHVSYTPNQAIQVANQLQSAGQLAEAESILLKILAQDSTHAHALHLYGVVLYQLGRIDLALSSIERAIASAPHEALFYSNAAEMARQQGRLKNAIEWGQRAVAENPMMASAHSNLGVALFDSGDLDAAQESHLKALALEPQLLQSLNTLGSIERARKDKLKAIDWYQKALAVNPHFLESMSNLGAVFIESDQANEAAPLLEKAIEINPNYPAGLCNLGLARIKQKRIAEAIALLQRSLQLHPNYLEAMIGLARAHYENQVLDDALDILQKVIESDGGRLDAHCLMGLIYTEQGKAELAEAVYRKVLAADASNTDAQNGIANIKMEAGELEQAKALFLSSIEIDPGNLDARFYLTQVAKVQANDKNTAVLEAMLSNTTLSIDKRISLHYALGKSYDDLAQYDKAFEQFSEGARLKRSQIHFDLESDAQFTDSIIKTVTTDYFESMKGVGSNSDVPIFILGMPRSGTTLVEQIIASHPDVFGAGELSDLFDVVQRPIDGLTSTRYPDVLELIQRDQITAWGDEYVCGLKTRAPDARKITDKMPANYLLMGLIPLMMPHAKIIHVKRDPVDTCLSCFTRLFNRHQSATYDLTELGHHYVNYERLMAHWKSILPEGSFIEVQYEDVVEDIDTQARRLLAFCDLDWDPRCLEFYKTKRNVRTASVSQVRQPIYRGSINRWRHYEKDLKPLLTALGL